MPNELDPIRGQWYAHLKKGQRFFISAVDEDGGTVEIQHFDGDLEEATFDEWRELDIELSVAPEELGRCPRCRRMGRSRNRSHRYQRGRLE